MSTSTAPAPERTDPAPDGAPGRGPDDGQGPGGGDGGSGREGVAPRETTAAPLWLLAGVEQDEGTEPHIWRGID
jgi:hypothetical protein